MTLNIPEVAESLGVSVRTVWRLVGDGELPSCRIGGRTVVRVVDLEKFLADLAGATGASDGHE